MLPSALTSASFALYPAQARAVAVTHLGLLRQMPLAFLPSFLQELADYDYKFPAERAELDGHLAKLTASPPEQLQSLFAEFRKIRVGAAEEAMDWVNQPQRFTEQYSAYLWSTGQMDRFRQAATRFGEAMQTPAPSQSQQVPRLGVAVIGQGMSGSHPAILEKLRSKGTYFNNVNPEGGLAKLLEAVSVRSDAHPEAYAHWYVDGGEAAPCASRVNQISYAALTPVRDRLLQKIQHQVSVPGMGPERLRDYLAQLKPEELGLRDDPLLDHFKVKLLTEGSGTQIYSTTFAQWAAREVLRRAAASTLLVRFAPRQRQRPMSELLAHPEQAAEVDAAGSLIDADMAAYYHWINQQRLPGFDRSAFLAWFEGQHQAIVIGPAVPRGVISTSPLDLSQLVALATA